MDSTESVVALGLLWVLWVFLRDGRAHLVCGQRGKKPTSVEIREFSPVWVLLSVGHSEGPAGCAVSS